MPGPWPPAILRCMKHASLTITLALLLLSACKSAPNTDAASPGSSATSDRATPHLAQGTGFDYYLLNLSWSPEFCYSHPECRRSAHRTPLSSCTVSGRRTPTAAIPKIVLMPRAPADPSAFSDIYPDQGLLQHEWHTHGTCSGLGADDFLTTARSAYRSIAIPPTLAGYHVANLDAARRNHLRSSPAPIRRSPPIASPSVAATTSSPPSKSASTNRSTPSPAAPSAPAAPTPSAFRRHASLIRAAIATHFRNAGKHPCK